MEKKIIKIENPPKAQGYNENYYRRVRTSFFRFLSIKFYLKLYINFSIKFYIKLS